MHRPIVPAASPRDRCHSSTGRVPCDGPSPHLDCAGRGSLGVWLARLISRMFGWRSSSRRSRSESTSASAPPPSRVRCTTAAYRGSSFDRLSNPMARSLYCCPFLIALRLTVRYRSRSCGTWSRCVSRSSAKPPRSATRLCSRREWWRPGQQQSTRFLGGRVTGACRLHALLDVANSAAPMRCACVALTGAALPSRCNVR